MKKLDLYKLAFDFAFGTLTLTGPALDSAIATEATEHEGLSASDYALFKQMVNAHRNQLLSYQRQDEQAAKVAQQKAENEAKLAAAKAKSVKINVTTATE